MGPFYHFYKWFAGAGHTSTAMNSITSTVCISIESHSIELNIESI
jgi:hypothetical protein